jgi:glutamate carboxypeptidase
MAMMDHMHRSVMASAEVMVGHLATLVSVETPSEDLAACAAGASAVSALAVELLGEAGETIEIDGRQHLHWRWPAPDNSPSVALVGHFDTVWPLGTTARWPFSVDDAAQTATGPGCFDMKAGIVQMFHAVGSLTDRSGIEILLTSDEELGSGTSQGVIEEIARRSSAAFILESAASPTTLKVGRKGTGWYRIDINGRAAHAGLEPEEGASALTELAHLVSALDDVARPEVGTTATPTLATAGTASNVVPATASLTIGAHAEGECGLDLRDAGTRRTPRRPPSCRSRHRLTTLPEPTYSARKWR